MDMISLKSAWADGIPSSKLRIYGESQSGACTGEAHDIGRKVIGRKTTKI